MTKKQSGKKYVILQGEPLDDGTINVVSINGQCLLDGIAVDRFLVEPPKNSDADIKVFELIGEYKAVHTWKEK